MKSDTSAQFRTALRQGIVGSFNASELKTLCADLGVDYDSLGGEGLEAKARELILYLTRRGALSDLVAYCASARPDYAWPQEGSAEPSPARPAAPRLRSTVTGPKAPADYTDLTIRIRDWNEAGGFYPVEAVLEDDGSTYENGQLRLNTQSLLANELNAEAYGVELFNALFTGPIRTAYDVATGRASGTDGRLRVRLRIDAGAAELHAIPWERLYRVGGAVMLPLATADQTPFSRYTSLSIPEPEPVAERPIKMLAALANPTGLPGGLPPANVEVEIQNLRRALGEMRKSGRLEVSLLVGRSGLPPELLTQLKSEGYQILEGATTLDNIVRYLPGQHIFHFIGHGSFNRKTEHGPGQAALHLEKDDGGWKPEKDDDIVKRFAAIGALPHLVFLVACESASRDSKGEDAFVGLGPKLVQAGFPAVVAMQAQVPVETARQLSGEFYRRLMEHGVVDKAMSEARRLMFKPNRTDWGIPVLFMRLKTGELFAEPGSKRVKGTTVIENFNVDTISGRDTVINTSANTFQNVQGPIVTRIGGGDSPDSGGVINIVDPRGGVSTKSGGGEGDGGINFGKATNISIGGDAVGRDKVEERGEASAEDGDGKQWLILGQQFKKVYKAIDGLALDEGDKDELKDLASKIETETKKGERADLRKLERWLGNIGDISKEALTATVKALTNIAAKVPEPIQAMARKMG